MYFNNIKPSYSGNIKLLNIDKEATVYFDDYGIPHIYAENEIDAITSLGYVHAQDRLWQMELMRRIAQEDYQKFLEKKCFKTINFL